MTAPVTVEPHVYVWFVCLFPPLSTKRESTGLCVVHDFPAPSSKGPLGEYLVKTHRDSRTCQSNGPCRHTWSCLLHLSAASLLSLPAQGPSSIAWTSDDAHLLPQNIHCLQQPVISLHSRQSTSPGYGNGGSSERPVPTFRGTLHSNPRVLGLSGVPHLFVPTALPAWRAPLLPVY